MSFAIPETSIAAACTASPVGQGATTLDGAGEGASPAGPVPNGNIVLAWIGKLT